MHRFIIVSAVLIATLIFKNITIRFVWVGIKMQKAVCWIMHSIWVLAVAYSIFSRGNFFWVLFVHFPPNEEYIYYFFGGENNGLPTRINIIV